jgi:hypothetical protein
MRDAKILQIYEVREMAKWRCCWGGGGFVGWVSTGIRCGKGYGLCQPFTLHLVAITRAHNKFSA